jgi:hypothetical protein
MLDGYALVGITLDSQACQQPDLGYDRFAEPMPGTRRDGHHMRTRGIIRCPAAQSRISPPRSPRATASARLLAPNLENTASK